jgi:predicted MFS family arabinose efflux permease
MIAPKGARLDSLRPASTHIVRLGRVLAVVAGGWGATFAVASLGPLQETMRIALRLTDSEISILQGPIVYVPSIILAVPLGYLIDRFSRPALLSCFLALEAIAVFVTGFAPSLIALLIARATIGLLMSAVAMDACALLGTLVSASWLGRAFMALAFAQVGGMSAAFYLGGLLLGHHAGDWRGAMMWMAAPLAAVFVLSLFVREPEGDRRARQGHTTLGEAARRAWQLRGMLWALAFGTVAVSVGYMASLVWASPILMRTAHLRSDRVGTIMGSILLVSALVGPSLGAFLSDRVARGAGPRRMITALIILAILEVPAGLFAVMPQLALFVILFTLLSIIFFLKGNLVSTISIAVIPNELRGFCFGVLNAVTGIFASIAPMAVSYLSTQPWGPNSLGVALTLVCVITSALGVVTFVTTRHAFPVRFSQ